MLRSFSLGLIFALSAAVATAADDGRMRLDGASYANPRPDEAAYFFNSGYVPLLKIQLEPKAFEALQREPRKYVICQVTEGDGTLYTNVAIHLKAGAGSFRGITDRPALTLNFDKYSPEQRFHGLDKVNLNNSVQDGTLCHELLGNLLFRTAGLPAARVSHARVELNGRMLGVYVLLEGLDTGFLRLHFGNGFGTLYDGSFHEVTDENLPKRARDPGTNAADLKALKAALEERDPRVRRQRLEPLLDVDRFLSFMALEAMVCHWDGYCNARNNYRVYHDPATDRLVFIAHGMDQIIGDPNGGLFYGNGWVARALTETPEDQSRYYHRVRMLRQTVYREEMLTNTVRQVAARLKPVFNSFDPQAGANHAGAVDDLCRRIVARGHVLDQQLINLLGIPWEPRPLTNWQSRVTEGNPTFRSFAEGGKPRLQVSIAATNLAAGSWRMRVTLPAGRYLFAGRARTMDVPSATDPALGATLRISGGPRRAGITGSTEWHNIEYEFATSGGATDIELVCELRADRGDAWFDVESLSLTKKEESK